MAEAMISILEWGLLRPGATSGVMRVWHSRFFRLETHIAPFQTSIDKRRLILPFDHDKLRANLLPRQVNFEACLDRRSSAGA